MLQVSKDNEIHLDGAPTGYWVIQHVEGTHVFVPGGGRLAMPRERYLLPADQPVPDLPGPDAFEADFRAATRL